jgi:hypothetical protein
MKPVTSTHNNWMPLKGDMIREENEMKAVHEAKAKRAGLGTRRGN